MAEFYRLVGDFGDDLVEDGRLGEVVIRSPSVMLGYVGRPEASNEAFSDGWIKTGDVGYCNEGKWYIVDRVKVSESPYPHFDFES